MKKLIQCCSRLYVPNVSLLCPILLLGVGCRSLNNADVQTFSKGITAAKAETEVSFKGVTDLTSKTIINYAAEQPTLNDANFFVVLSPDATASWDHVFSALEQYGTDLGLLTSQDLTKEYQDSAVNLAQQIQQTGEHLKEAGAFANVPDASPMLATAFTKLGDILLKAHAEHDAMKIMHATDPVIADVFARMASSVGDSQKTGLRGTIFAHWEQLKATKQVEFLKAVRAADPAKRLDLAQEFANLLQQQQAQDLSLTSLRRSFLALARAHHELANGNNLSASHAVNEIVSELNDTKALYERFKTATDTGGKKAQ